MAKPEIIIKFRGEHSSQADIHIENCDYSQVLAAGKILEMQGEGMFMQERMAQVSGQRGLVVAAGMPRGLSNDD